MSRNTQGLFENLVDLLARSPWWVGIVLAATSYIGFHQLAVMEVAAPIGTKGVGDFVGMQIYKAFATYLQYIVPAVCVVGSALSVYYQRKRNALHSQVSRAGTRDRLESMSWQDFELLVGEHFRRQGFSVSETSGGGADGGVDLVLSRDSDRYFVQCKQWKARQVGVASVRELYGVMAARGAAGGYVITSGVFTDEARRFAEGLEIELIEGDRLAKLIAGQSVGSARSAGHQARPLPGRARPEPSVSSAEVPACPECGSIMVLRTASKGNNAGKSFWGCPTFPKCRGTRPGDRCWYAALVWSIFTQTNNLPRKKKASRAKPKSYPQGCPQKM